jgi:hypothetical protein
MVADGNDRLWSQADAKSELSERQLAALRIS